MVGALDCRCYESLFPTTTYQLGRFLGQFQHSSTSSDTKSPACQPIARCPVAAEFRTPGGAQSGTETGAGRSHRGRYRLHQPMAHWGRFVWDRKKRKRLTCPPALPPEGLLGFTVWGEVTDKAVRRTDSCGQSLEYLVDNLSGQRGHVTCVIVCCPFRV